MGKRSNESLLDNHGESSISSNHERIEKQRKLNEEATNRSKARGRVKFEAIKEEMRRAIARKREAYEEAIRADQALSEAARRYATVVARKREADEEATRAEETYRDVVVQLYVDQRPQLIYDLLKNACTSKTRST